MGLFNNKSVSTFYKSGDIENRANKSILKFIRTCIKDDEIKGVLYANRLAIANAYLVITSKALIYTNGGSHNMSGGEVPLLAISKISCVRSGKKDYITIIVGDSPMVFEVMCSNEDAQSCCQFIHEYIKELYPDIYDVSEPVVEKIDNKVAQEVVSNNVADDILKFKNLLDMGAISQQEYDAKKEQLLKL